MRHVLFSGLALATLLAAVAPLAAAPAEESLDTRVVAAVRRAVTYLRGRQRSKGDWETNLAAGMHPGGQSSLVLLALLTSGVPATDPAVQQGLKYLRTVGSKTTYVVSLQTMVFARAGEAADRERIRRNVDWLLKNRLPNGWSYGTAEGAARSSPDNSNTQYALLGLEAGLRAGARVPRKDLEEVRKFYLDTQVNGGWPYRVPRTRGAEPLGPPTLTMTTAGLCGLLIIDRYLDAGKHRLRADGSAEHCGVYADDRAIDKALAWLGDRFPARLTREVARTRLVHPFYALYGIERAGRLSGRRFFGGRDWYEVGARYLVTNQKVDGSWGGNSEGRQLDHWPEVATSFALLFLARGRTPVLITKLAYGPPDFTGWNNKRNDARHLAEFVSRTSFNNKPLAWQVFDVRSAAPETEEDYDRLAARLLESPVVYLSGHELPLRPRDEQLLKKYLEKGGFLFAEACCGSKEFDRDFRKLMGRLFPDTPLRPLAADHPVWRASGKFALTPKDCPLEGVQKGGRTRVVYSPKPLAGYWEADQHDKGPGRIAFRVGAGVTAYATGLKVPPPRGHAVKTGRAGEK